ncbi:MAG: BatD family protein [Candidatus Heimdallarchaeota archaeon]
MTKTRYRSLVSVVSLIWIVTILWPLPVREVNGVLSSKDEDIPLLAVRKELNATRVDLGTYCLVTITISNLSNATAYNVKSKDTVFPTWVFEIKGSSYHSWISLGNKTSVSYSYILIPKKHGTFQLQSANVTYTSKNEKSIRYALSNEVEFFVAKAKVLEPTRDVEALQTVLLAEITIFLILLAAVLARRKKIIAQT